MANFLPAAAGGNLGDFPLETWFYEMPPCTRWWTTATVATSILVQCEVLTPFQLFYSWKAVWGKNQVRVFISVQGVEVWGFAVGYGFGQ